MINGKQEQTTNGEQINDKREGKEEKKNDKIGKRQ